MQVSKAANSELSENDGTALHRNSGSDRSPSAKPRRLCLPSAPNARKLRLIRSVPSVWISNSTTVPTARALVEVARGPVEVEASGAKFNRRLPYSCDAYKPLSGPPSCWRSREKAGDASGLPGGIPDRNVAEQFVATR